jgi:preprotein translocase SecE subunit
MMPRNAASFYLSIEMDNRKYNMATFLSISFLFAVSLKGISETILLQSDDLGDPLIFGLFRLTLLIGVAVFVLTFSILSKTVAVVQFTDESWTELRTVTWPEKEETVRSTVVVIVVTLFIAFMLATYDFVWTKVASETLFGKDETQEEEG